MRRQQAELILPPIALGLTCLGLYLLDRYSATYRMYFSWPNGLVWSSVFAWLLGLAMGAFVTWYLRDRIGQKATAWWHSHNPMHESQDAIHQIVADIYVAVNGGEEHPLAPANGGGSPPDGEEPHAGLP